MNNLRRGLVVAWQTVGPDKALMAFSSLFVLLVAVQGVRYLVVGRAERSVLESLTQKTGGVPERDKVKPLKEYDQTIMDHGMLGPASPPPKLWGVMGNMALIGVTPTDAQPYKVGDATATGEKVVEIRPNEVALEKDGKRRTEVLFEELKQSLEAAPGTRSDRAPGAAPGASPGSPPGAAAKSQPRNDMKPAAPPDSGEPKKPK